MIQKKEILNKKRKENGTQRKMQKKTKKKRKDKRRGSGKWEVESGKLKVES